MTTDTRALELRRHFKARLKQAMANIRAHYQRKLDRALGLGPGVGALVEAYRNDPDNLTQRLDLRRELLRAARQVSKGKPIDGNEQDSWL